MKTDQIKEIVVYSIKSSSEGEVDHIQKLVKNCLKDCSGFISVESMKNAKDSTTLVDFVYWDNLQNAEKAQKIFEKNSSFPELMKHLGEMKFSGHFINN